ncbi:GNAT family N-acetyltransferase [Glutamicibacter sp.]|uniref:GNAT family N-acetyltransferase n=1 Tax=Glutamicibacter sp. TaxID=1931995 RepID=UPI0028BD69F9|nr:GNAT family N-acetyltransferase [Glutamicibacter sp.]
MFENLTFSLSCLSPNAVERAELASLYSEVDERWQQKMDRARAVVTVRDGELLVAAGVVHDSILAPTSAMDALELGSMAVRPDYRRMGIRQHVTSLRLEFALKAGGTPITIINSANPASWAYYERSELWERERSFEQDEQTKFIYRATESARDWAASLPQASQDAIKVVAAAEPMPSTVPTIELETSLEQVLELPAELSAVAALVPAILIGPEADDHDPLFEMHGADSENDWFGTAAADPAF